MDLGFVLGFLGLLFRCAYNAIRKTLNKYERNNLYEACTSWQYRTDLKNVFWSKLGCSEYTSYGYKHYAECRWLGNWFGEKIYVWYGLESYVEACDKSIKLSHPFYEASIVQSANTGSFSYSNELTGCCQGKCWPPSHKDSSRRRFAMRSCNEFYNAKCLPWLSMPSRIATFTGDAQLWSPARREPSECCSLKFTLWVADFNSQATCVLKQEASCVQKCICLVELKIHWTLCLRHLDFHSHLSDVFSFLGLE